jgi:flavin-dependent dehydrogenase
MVAQATGAADRERRPGVRALYYQYVGDMPGPSGGAPDGPEFSALGDELAYVFPSDAGLTCVAISVNLDEYERLRRDVRAGFPRLLERHRGLWDRYAASRPQGQVLGSGPMPDYVRQAAGPGWALVGDAGMHQDPWSGLGMDSAGVAAKTLVDTYVEHGDSPGWSDVYERRRDEQLLDGFHQTVAGAADLSALPD